MKKITSLRLSASLLLLSSALTTLCPLPATGTENIQEEKSNEKKEIKVQSKFNPFFLLEGNFKTGKSNEELKEIYQNIFIDEYIDKDKETQGKSIPKFEELAQHGHTGSMSVLGQHYENQEDNESAFCWYMTAFITNFRNGTSNNAILKNIDNLKNKNYILAEVFSESMKNILKHNYITKKKFNTIKEFNDLFLTTEVEFKKNFSEYYFTIFLMEFFEQNYKGTDVFKKSHWKSVYKEGETYQDYKNMFFYNKGCTYNKLCCEGKKSHHFTTAELYLERSKLNNRYYDLGRLSEFHQNYTLSHEYYKKALKEHPKEEVYFFLGKLYLEGFIETNLPIDKHITQAKSYFLKYKKKFCIELIYYYLATACYLQNNNKDAIRYIEQSKTAESNILMAEILYENAIKAYINGNSTDTKELLKKAKTYLIKSISQELEIQHLEDKRESLQKNTSQFLDILSNTSKKSEKVKKEIKSPEESTFSLEKCLEEINKFKNTKYKKAEMSYLYNRIAVLHYEEKKFDLAWEYLEKSLNELPFFQTYENIGYLYARGLIETSLTEEERLKKALSYFLEANFRLATRGDNLAALGEIYYLLKDYEKAEFYLLKEWSDLSLYRLGHMYFYGVHKTKDIEKALQYLKLSKDPKSAALMGGIYYELALNAREEEKSVEAQSYLNQSIINLNKALYTGAKEKEDFISKTNELLQKVIQLSEIEEEGVEENDSEEIEIEEINNNEEKILKIEELTLNQEIKIKPKKEKKISKKEKRKLEKELSLQFLTQRREEKIFEIGSMGEKKDKDIDLNFISDEVKDMFEEITNTKNSKDPSYKKIMAIFENTNFHTGESSIGKLEALKGDLKGWFSLRITQEHRLVYTIQNGEILIGACHGHYENEDALIKAIKNLKQQKKN